MKKSIIGVVSKHNLKDEIRPNMYIRDEVKQALFDNGAIAIGILLPKDEKKDVCDEWQNNLTNYEYNNLITQINLCDGIVFQGGGACDNYEMIIAKYCYDNDIPTLGLCCGQNVMVRALGGTTKIIPNPDKHNVNDLYVHSVNVDKNSKLYDILKKEIIMVNSRHKKTIDKHPGLCVSATCDYGYVEALESKNKKFYMSFRFHPESLYKIDDNMNKIFKYFIKICCKNK